MFKLNINNKEEVFYDAKMYNFSDNISNFAENGEGKFSVILKEKDYEELINAINRTKFPNLQDKYSINITDAQTVRLKITYDGGEIKEIIDYDASGTEDLEKVYKILFNLRENQNWNKIE